MVVLVGLADVVVVVDDEIVVDSVADVVGVVLVGFVVVGLVEVGLVDIAVVVDDVIVVVLVAVVVGVLLVGLVVVSLVVAVVGIVVVPVIYLIQGQPSYEMLQSLLISLVTALFYYQ